jgi:hypothetical protein
LYKLNIRYDDDTYAESIYFVPDMHCWKAEKLVRKGWADGGDSRDVDYAHHIEEMLFAGDWSARLITVEERAELTSKQWWSRTKEQAKEIIKS